MYEIIFFLVEICIYSSSIITFPFKRIFTNEVITKDNFYDNYFDNIIYTKSYIGTPFTEVTFQIKSKQYTLCLRNDTIYHYMNSTSYIANEQKDIYVYNIDFRSSLKSNETFKLGNEKINIADLQFMLSKESKYTSDGIIGLKILDNDGQLWGYNLIPQLKKKKLIKEESFFYIFDENSDNGELIIGQYPHLIEKYKNTFYEEQFQKTSVFIPSYDQNFDFKFRSVFWNGTEIESLTVANLEIELGMIKGSMKFCDQSWDFFAPHFRKGKCTIVDIRVLYESYICDDYPDFDITKFPSIKFYVNDADYNFELTYKEIFKKKDGKVFFMIYFNKKGYDVTWSLGNLFLKRNMLVFDMDKKIIGFYNKEIKINDSSNNNDNTRVIVLSIIIIFAAFVIIGLVAFIIYKFVVKKPRKKPYELPDDDYDYTTNTLNS